MNDGPVRGGKLTYSGPRNIADIQELEVEPVISGNPLNNSYCSQLTTRWSDVVNDKQKGTSLLIYLAHS